MSCDRVDDGVGLRVCVLQPSVHLRHLDSHSLPLRPFLRSSQIARFRSSSLLKEFNYRHRPELFTGA